MWLMMLRDVNLHDYPNQLVDGHPRISLFQVIPLEAKHLAVLDYDTHFLRQPAWSRPQLPAHGTVGHHRVQQKDGRHPLDSLADGDLLVPATNATPTPVLCLAFDTCL